MEKTESVVGRWQDLGSHGDFLRGWLQKNLRDEHEVEDVLQETLLRAARYRTPLEDEGKLRGWLLRIAHNVLNDTLQRDYRSGRRRGAGGEEQLALVEGREPDPGAREEERLEVCGEYLERGELLEHMRGCLPELREQDRRLLLSFYGGDGSCAKVGLELGLGPALVKVRLFRARQRLARSMERSVQRSLERDRMARGR